MKKRFLSSPTKDLSLGSTLDSKSESSKDFLDSTDISKGEDKKAYSVSGLNALIKGCIEDQFQDVYVKGEISNFCSHTSGHFYFRLKDESSQIQALMFRSSNSRLKFKPKDGLEVLVKARISVYEPRGNYQLICHSMEPLGEGALRLAFEQLKETLYKEGLFAKSLKKPLPLYPQHIAIVTSPTGAAIRDMLNILKRRSYSLKVTLVPALVQGEGAQESLIKALALADSLRSDLIICGRGGGSIEDLWAFNEESVVRAFLACSTPTISAVGHEIDYTICDFVADLRASTPSVAAELAVRDRHELLQKVISLHSQVVKRFSEKISSLQDKLSFFSQKLSDPSKVIEDKMMACDEFVLRLNRAQNLLFKHKEELRKTLSLSLINPQERIEQKEQKRQSLEDLLKNMFLFSLSEKQLKIRNYYKALDNLSPLNVLGRGYSLSYKGNEIVKNVNQLKKGDVLEIQFDKGQVSSVVNSINKKNKFYKKGDSYGF